MFAGVPAGIITVLLVLLAAFLIALYGRGFRKGVALPAIGPSCICNPLPVFHLCRRQLCASFCRQATVELQSGRMTFPHHGLLDL